jgi:hypothetical protein
VFPGGEILSGEASALDPYSGITGPGSFGSGVLTFASSGSGDFVGILGDAGQLIVPPGYVSDSPPSDTATYAGQTFATLGVMPGTYKWT